MKISLNWISDFVDISGIDVKDLWNRFTMSTAEVDDVAEMGGDIRNVVVGRVVKVEPHPASDKLKVVLVDTGKSGIIQSLCGAPNIREGMLVPFAMIGGSIKKLPQVTGMSVEGTESRGIVCSAMEIGMSDDHEGVLVLPDGIELGTDIKKIIALDDVIIETDNKSLTNRPDLWGHYGIAREVAAIFGRKLKPLEVADIQENPGGSCSNSSSGSNSSNGSTKLPGLSIKIEDEKKCFRYSGLAIENIKVRRSPFNMQTRLYYCGMRPISPIVDLTNYLMLETGQPMHAFDRRFIDNIVVRSTDAPERFVTLDGIERVIPTDVLMICDSGRPVAVAGIMGGENSEVSPDTDAIILESANFEGSSIRRSSTKIGMRTEASARFEKMLDPELTAISIKRFMKLLLDMQGDVRIASELTDVYPVRPKPVSIDIDKQYIDKYVGGTIDAGRVEAILRSLEFGVKCECGLYHVDVPTFRATRDITIKADIIEEITRIYGYDNIVPKTVDVPLQPLEYNEERLYEHKTREALSEKFAMSEVNSYIWYDDTWNAGIGIGARGNVRILNPQAHDMSVLRDSMAPGMLCFAEKNGKAFEDFSIYEIGSVFSAPDDRSKAEQHKSLCILAASKTKSEDDLFYRLKGIALFLMKLLRNTDIDFTDSGTCRSYPWVHPVKSVDASCGGRALGYIAAVHPMIRQNIDKKMNMAVLEFDMGVVYAAGQGSTRYIEPSRYPEVTLDYNFLVPKTVAYKKVCSDIESYKHVLLTGYSFIDMYAGKGVADDMKSMTFRFRLGSRDKTLSSGEVDEYAKGFLDHMKKYGYALR